VLAISSELPIANC